MERKRKIILVTDGDKKARKAIEVAAKNIGGRCISRSAGNPTILSGEEIVDLVVTAKYDPVVVMVDDKGNPGFGIGEQALMDIVKDNRVKILGVVAVASNTEGVSGVEVNFSIDGNGKLVKSGVDKNGDVIKEKKIYGDTVDIIDGFDFPVIVGIGDVGKMRGHDCCEKGAPIITKAFEEILERNETLYEDV